MRATAATEVEDGWTLLSIHQQAPQANNRSESHLHQSACFITGTPQVTGWASKLGKKAGKLGSKAKKAILADVNPKPRDLPLIMSHQRLEEPFKDECSNQVGGKSCVVPEVFALSPTSSPRNPADFMETEASPPPSPSRAPVQEPSLPAAAHTYEATDKDVAQEAASVGGYPEVYVLGSSGSWAAGTIREIQQGMVTVRLTDGVEEKISAELMHSRVRLGPVKLGPQAVTTLASQTSPILVDHEDSFVHVSPTTASAARHFATVHPRIARRLLWAWFTFLVLGELATTLWWLYSLGFHGFVLICAPAGLGLSFGLLMFGQEQMIAIAVFFSLAAQPALPGYSAVLLMTSPGRSPQQDSSWDIIHWPMLVILGMTYLVTAWVPALRAERPAPQSTAHTVLKSLEMAQRLTRSACIISAYLYGAIVLHVGARRLLTWCQQTDQAHSVWYFWGGVISDPLLTGHGLVLTLHTVGLLCATARQYTVAELGDDLLPRLLGAQRAKALTPRALVMTFGSTLLRQVPQFRRYTPPPTVVALILAVRRTAPVLFPVLAVLSQLASRESRGGNSWPALSLLLGMIVLVLLVLAAAHEKRALPASSLQRLPLLLPQGIAPSTRKCLGYSVCTRKTIGYVLVAAERVERARRRITNLCAHLNWPGAESKSHTD